MYTQQQISEWTVHYIEHKDAFQKRIKSLEPSAEKIRVTYPDRPHNYLILMQFKNLDQCLGCITPQENYTFVLLNTAENLEVLQKSWQAFSKVKNLLLLFVNPDSEGDKKWLLNPYSHNLIADKESLNAGLKAMFETVAPVTK